MPLFQIDQSALVQISATNFPFEKEKKNCMIGFVRRSSEWEDKSTEAE